MVLVSFLNSKGELVADVAECQYSDIATHFGTMPVVMDCERAYQSDMVTANEVVDRPVIKRKKK